MNQVRTVIPKKIVLASREDAERVLEHMTSVIQHYGVASLSDYYDLVGLESSYVDNKWGWTLLVNTKINKTDEGYVIDFPSMEAIV